MITLKTNGLLMKLARIGGVEEHRQLNLCNVFWAVIWGLVKYPLIYAAIIFFSVLVLGLLVVLPAAQLIAYALEGITPEWLVIGMLLFVDTVAMCIALTAWLEHTNRQKQAEKIVEVFSSPFTLAGQLYRGWKEKTCVLVQTK